MIFSPREGQKLLRYEIFPWEGINLIVADNITKKGEPAYLENFRSTKIGWLDKRAGHALFGTSIYATSNYGLYDFVTDNHILLRVSKVSGTISIFYFNEQSSTWVQLTGAGTNLSPHECDFTVAGDECFVVNGYDANRYIEADGLAVTDSSDSTGQLYNSPTGRLVAFYKSRLYIGDYLNIDGTRNRTGVCYSSVPLGIVSLVSGDQTAPITTLTVTDTQYIKVGAVNDSLDVYRGGTLIGTITVTDKTATTLIISSFGTDLLSNDELWVAGTRSGQKQFRWDNRATGISAHQYDNFPNPSSESITALETVNNNLMVFTKNSINLWNGSVSRPLDLNIGCVSRKSFVKILGQGIFLHYTGIYSTTGGVPTLLSAKIQPIFDGANAIALENSCAAISGFSYFIYIGQVTLYQSDGSIKKVLNDVVVELNLRQNNFFIHTDIHISHFSNYVQNGTLKLLFAKHATPPAPSASPSSSPSQSPSSSVSPSASISPSVSVSPSDLVSPSSP